MDKVMITTTTEKFPAMPTITWTTKRDNTQLETPPDPKRVELVLTELKTALCKSYDLSWEEITGASREPEKVSARFLYYYFLHVFYDLSVKSISRMIGQRHNTALWALKQVTDRLESQDPAWDEFKQRYLEVESKLPDITLY